MDKPSEKNLGKMRTYAEKFAEKSGTYLHPDHEVTDVVVEGLARHIEEVGKPLCPCNFYPDKAAEAKMRRWILCLRRDANLQILPLSAVCEPRRSPDYRTSARRS